MHSLVRFCRGMLTITNNGLRFESNQHTLEYTNATNSFRAKFSTNAWDIEVLDQQGKKVTSFDIFDWTNSSPLRSMWGKPSRKDNSGWQYRQ